MICVEVISLEVICLWKQLKTANENNAIISKLLYNNLTNLLHI